MTLHTAFPKGTKIFVIMKDKKTFADHFLDKNKKHLIFKERGEVPIKDIRSSTIYRRQPHED